MARWRRTVAAISLGLGSLLLSGGLAVTAAPVTDSATGEGAFDVLGQPGSFSAAALLSADGTAKGSFHFELILGGELVDFDGAVTCVSFDALNHRAWVGGVVTANRSVRAAYTTPRTQPGRDIWFRAVDYGEGAASPADRTSFVGFEGDAGVITSAEYCAAQLWPMTPPDDRTWPVVEGNIQVRAAGDG